MACRYLQSVASRVAQEINVKGWRRYGDGFSADATSEAGVPPWPTGADEISRVDPCWCQRHENRARRRLLATRAGDFDRSSQVNLVYFQHPGMRLMIRDEI